MSGVPQAVDGAIEFWRAGHRQGPVGWSRAAWLAWLDGHEALIHELPNPLSRTDVVAYFGAIEDEATAVDAFIAAMVWGYGPIGYGAWRTRRILDENAEAGKRLQEVHRETAARGGPGGFRFLAENRLKHLGVAFGTKYLFFSAESAGTAMRAPVLDRIVRAWLAENTALTLDIWSWRPKHYDRYCRALADWGEARYLTAGEVEEAIFEFATRGPVHRRTATAEPGELLEQVSRLVWDSDRAGEEKAAAEEALDALSDFFGEA